MSKITFGKQIDMIAEGALRVMRYDNTDTLVIQAIP